MLNETPTPVKTFDLKSKEYHRIEIPKHIKFENFKTIHKHLHEQNNKKLEIIVRLMYESGLRSGEVLSLTYEDIKVEYKDGNQICKVILRNRYGNPVDRSPKFLKKVKSRNDYHTQQYRQKGYGWNEMLISKLLYEMILDYIEEEHSYAQQEKNTEQTQLQIVLMIISVKKITSLFF